MNIQRKSKIPVNTFFFKPRNCLLSHRKVSTFYHLFYQIKNNICLNSVGHGLFVEDGGEKHTLFEGNLALGQRAWTGLINHPITGALPSDRYFH